jgi:hypothetical protein
MHVSVNQLQLGLRQINIAIVQASLLATLSIVLLPSDVSAQDEKKSATESKTESKSGAEDSPEQIDVKLGLNLKEERAFAGYTLLAPMFVTETYLLDMEGRVVHTWQCGCRPGHSAYLLEDGTLLRAGALERDEHPMAGTPGAGGRVQKYSWEGELLWDYRLANETQLQHHDICGLPNGNVLMIAWEKKTRDEALAAGRDPQTINDAGLQPDCLIEVKPTGKTTGEVVWEWHLWDHLVQDRDRSKANYGNVAEHPELVDLNYGEGLAALLNNPQAVNQLAGIGYVAAPAPDGRPPRINPDWTHFNSVAYNADLDQVMVSVHAFSEIWIIDHSTTKEEAAGHTGGRYGKGGDLLYRWGNPLAYRAGSEKDQTLFKQHNAHWIPRGLPGEGHVLVFNNNHASPEGNYSSVDEIVLPANERGEFQKTTGEAFGPKEAVWSYTAPKKPDLNSGFISGAQRLANGNTLICSGANGTFIEVTSDKDMVWKYINPTKGRPDFPGGPGFNVDGPPPIGQILPRFVRDMLQLTDEQKKQIDDIEKHANESVEKVLNDDQRKQLADLRRNPPDGGVRVAAGGPGGPNFGPPGDGGPNFGPPGRVGRRGRRDGDSDRNPRPQGGRDGGPNFGPPGGGGPGLGPRGRGGPGGPFGGPPGGGSVFRVYRYGADYPGLAGRDLAPGKTLVEIVEEQEKAKSQDNGDKKDSADTAKT